MARPTRESLQQRCSSLSRIDSLGQLDDALTRSDNVFCKGSLLVQRHCVAHFQRSVRSGSTAQLSYDTSRFHAQREGKRIGLVQALGLISVDEIDSAVVYLDEYFVCGWLGYGLRGILDDL